MARGPPGLGAWAAWTVVGTQPLLCGARAIQNPPPALQSQLHLWRTQDPAHLWAGQQRALPRPRACCPEWVGWRPGQWWEGGHRDTGRGTEEPGSLAASIPQGL